MTVTPLQRRPEEGASTLEWARAYAARGWHVFPVNRNKTPATPNGWKDATADVRELGKWNWAGKLIGVACAPSGLLCVDVDIKRDSGGRQRDGTVWLDAMEAEHGDIPRDIEARTGSGGWHIILKAPPGPPVMLVGANGFKDVDLIGNGYFVVEPSVSEAGDYYWLDDQSPWDAEPPECQWVYDLCAAYTRPRENRANRTTERVPKDDELSSDEVAMLDSALAHLDPGMGRGPWIQVGMAINAKSGGSRVGLQLWDAWSRKSDKYPGIHEIEKQWATFDPFGGTTLGTVYAMAKEQGWERDVYELEQRIEQAAEENPGWVELFNRAREALLQHGPERPRLEQRKLWSMGEILAMDFPKTDWLIQGILTEGAVFVIGGEPKTSKTWAGLEILISAISGLRCFGELPAKRVDKPAVAFLAEDQQRSLRNRLRSLSAGHGFDPRPLGHKLSCLNLQALDLASVDSTAALVADIWSAHPDGISILYLDPLRDLHRAEENDSGAMAEVMGRLRALRAILGCAVVFVHHSHKASQGTSGRRAGQGLRGSSAVHGAVDGGLYLSGLKVNAEQNEFENRAAVELKALRGAGTFTLTLEIDDDSNGEALRASWHFSRPKGTDSVNAEDKVSSSVAWLVAKGEPFGPSAVAEKAGVSKSTATKYLQRFVEEGRLGPPQKGQYAPDGAE